MKIFNFKNGFIKNSSKLGLICQTHNTYYENKITSNKANIKQKTLKPNSKPNQCQMMKRKKKN